MIASMDLAQLLFVAIAAVGTLATVCAFVGARRWHRRLVDVRTLMLLAALLWVPATVDLVVRQQMLDAQQLGAWVTDWWIDSFVPSTVTASTTTTTTP